MDQTDKNSIDTWYRKYYCDVLMRLYVNTHGKKFRIGYIVPAIMDLIKIPNTKRVNKKDPVNINPDDKEALYIFEKLLSDDMILPSITKYDGTGKNKRAIKLYKMNTLKLKTCEKRSGYYKKAQYKQKTQEKTKKLDYRKCDLLLTLYGYFGDRPFTFGMVKTVFDIINNMQSEQYRERELLSYMRKRYSNRELLNIWNSVVQNKMIRKYTPKKTLKKDSVENEYRIVKSYLEFCAKKIQNK